MEMTEYKEFEEELETSVIDTKIIQSLKLLFIIVQQICLKYIY